MNKRILLWTLSVLGMAAIAVLSVLLYHEHQLRRSVTIAAENHYQQAYHELSYDVDALEDSLGTALAMHSRESMRPQLTDAWRLSTLAHAAIGELPLTLLPFNRTSEFLSHVSEFTYQSSVRAISDRAFSDKEYRQLQTLYKESQSISSALRRLQSQVMRHHLRWMDVELALRSKKQNEDNQVIDGLKRVDGQASDYTQSFSPENPRNLLFKKNSYRDLSGQAISRNDVLPILKKWLNDPDAYIDKITATGKGAGIPAYLANGHDVHARFYAAISRKGGHVIWFLSEQPSASDRYGMHDAEQSAATFLKDQGFSDMLQTKVTRIDHTALLTYVPVKSTVRLYPASVKVKVALDTKRVVGFDQSDYLANTCDLPLQAKLSEADARKQLNANLHVEESHLAVLQSASLKNMLCYEFFVTSGVNTYRVLINALNGDQEKAELMQD
ncbi:MAG: germination protein YpeB [Sporolactobacillus sp.]